VLNNNFSFQLFSARNTPLDDALEIVAQAGYQSVEAYRDNVIDLSAFQRGLEKNNLGVSSIHVGRDELKNDMVKTLELDLQWEIDLGWIQKAALDPASWLRTYPDRISAVHLKDVAGTGECEDEDGWADVGYGVIDWSEILPELHRCEAEIFVVEHDNPSDLKRFAERSYKTVSEWENYQLCGS